jgi:hypothetical protein
MALWFITEQGEVTNVQAASEVQFAALLDRALTLYQHTESASQECLDTVKQELAGLDYDDCGKWFALLVLQEACIPVPLFPTSTDAQASGSEHVLL